VTIIQTKLNQSGRNDRRRDLTKGRQCADVDRTRETKNRVIPQVEDIHAEPKFMTFLDTGGLDYREVPVLLVWTTERISRYITKTGGSGAAARNEAGGAETGWIQVVRQAICRGACGVHRGNIGTTLAAEGSCAAARLTERATAATVSDREGQAALISDDTADGPAFEELVVPEMTIRYRQIV